MKVKFTVIDDDGKEHSGELELTSGKPTKKIEKTTVKSAKADDYKGTSGGIRLLIDSNFLSTPKSLGEIKKEFEKEGYFQSNASISKILTRDFVTRKKILSRIKKESTWRYVVRK